MLKSPATSTDLPTETPETDPPVQAALPARAQTDRFVGLDRSPNQPAAAIPARLGRTATETDAVIAAVADEVLADPNAYGLVLHGSRALGLATADSNYDFLCLLADDAYEQRSQRGTTVERRFHADSPTLEISYESLGRFRRGAIAGSPRSAALAFARLVVDKSGEVEALLNALLTPGGLARDSVADDYDRYLHGFAHSLKAWSRGDDLGARAHAAQSALHLVAALYGLEGRYPPYPDQLSVRLAELDEPQGWRPGFLRGAVVRLFYAPDPPHQQMLERRVRRLIEARGIRHRWRHDLDRLRTISYDEL